VLDPTKRFSTRVENYIRYRPGYPGTLLPLLEEHRSLRPGDIVADLGFGTGKLTVRLLQRGHTVHAIEPNESMREAGRRLAADERCHVIDGSAEATGLPDANVDLAVAAQAFHWFDLEPTLAELARILRPEGRVALIWNVRDEERNRFMAEYEALLATHGTDYRNVGAHRVDNQTRERLFGSDRGKFHWLPNEQRLDRDGLIGRVLSASYVPEPGRPGHEEMIAALEELFRRHERNGEVTLHYRTQVYHGPFCRRLEMV
jgi:SAM-dependent methyltransferase